MNKRKRIVFVSISSAFLLTIGILYACKGVNHKDGVRYEIDHLILFVKDTTVQTELDRIFTRAQKLETQHQAQGTRGVYYLFLNSFIELLYLEDSVSAVQNQARFQSEYLERWKTDEGFSNLGLVLRMIPFDTARIMHDFNIYRSDDNPDGEFYVMFRGNKEVKQPMTAITMPHRQQKVFQSIDEAVKSVRPEIKEDLKRYLSHHSGVMNISGIELYADSRERQINLEVLKSTENVEVLSDLTEKLVIVFDQHRQNKTFNIRNGNLPIEVKY